MTRNPVQKNRQSKGVKKGRIFCFISAVLLICSSCGYFWVEPYGDIARDEKPVRADGQPVFMPENAPSITQGYMPQLGKQSASGDGQGHNGIDITAERGTPVLAPAPGVVRRSYYEPMYGNHVEMDLGRDEMGRRVLAKFLHLQKRLAKEGDTVGRGEQIGTLGSTGILAAGLPHVHYAVFVADYQGITEPINPHRLWADGAGKVTCFDSSRNWPEAPLKTTYPVPCRGIDWR
jgi:murein DD-endopeptidase MepM/ murein hydrolase activator NlpD